MLQDEEQDGDVEVMVSCCVASINCRIESLPSGRVSPIKAYGIWLNVMAVLKRLTRLYHQLGLAPNVTLTTGVPFWPD